MAVTGAAQPNQARDTGPMTIRGLFNGRLVTVTASHRTAGAIESVQWGGLEFVDAHDHGRELQSAVSFDGLTECDNPTEAGSRRDGAGPRSSSLLHSGIISNNALRTQSRMAYWLQPGEWSAECGYARNEIASALSSTGLSKVVRFLPGFGNILEHTITFDLMRPRSLAQFEVLTAYMPGRFDTFFKYNFMTDHMEELSDGPGEQSLPVVLASNDGAYALGLYTPPMSRLISPGYGRWRFRDEQVTKSNVVYRVENAEAGSHSFVVYTVFGTFDDVRLSLAALHKKYGPEVVTAY